MKKKSTRQVKYHAKFRYSGVASFTKQQVYSSLCLRSCGYGLLTAQQIETSRRLIRRRLKKTGLLLIRVRPFLTRTVKALGVRMGHGKSAKVRDQVCLVRPGKIIFQVNGVSVNLARTALLGVRSKLNFPTRLTSLTDF
jgi:large subunit ribosomal protein L16